MTPLRICAYPLSAAYRYLINNAIVATHNSAQRPLLPSSALGMADSIDLTGIPTRRVGLADDTGRGRGGGPPAPAPALHPPKIACNDECILLDDDDDGDGEAPAPLKRRRVAGGAVTPPPQHDKVDLMDLSDSDEVC
jgi:hypothetical protein